MLYCEACNAICCPYEDVIDENTHQIRWNIQHGAIYIGCKCNSYIKDVFKGHKIDAIRLCSSCNSIFNEMNSENPSQYLKLHKDIVDRITKVIMVAEL